MRRTLRVMVDVASTFKCDLHIRTLAVCLVGGRVVTLVNGCQVRYPLCRPKDYEAELRCLHAFVRDHVRYVRDIEGVETLQTPIQTLNVLAGDCDDKSMLFCAHSYSIMRSSRGGWRSWVSTTFQGLVRTFGSSAVAS